MIPVFLHIHEKLFEQSIVQCLIADQRFLVLDKAGREEEYIYVTDRLEEIIDDLGTCSKKVLVQREENDDLSEKIAMQYCDGIIKADCSIQDFLEALEHVWTCHCSDQNEFEATPSVSIKGIDKLSPKEMEVLRLIGEGLTTTQISEVLYRSTHTVNSHRKNLIKKLHLSRASDLGRLASRHFGKNANNK